MPFLGATELGEGRQAGSPPILVRVRGGVVVVAGRPNNISVSRLGARKVPVVMVASRNAGLHQIKLF